MAIYSLRFPVPPQPLKEHRSLPIETMVQQMEAMLEAAKLGPEFESDASETEELGTIPDVDLLSSELGAMGSTFHFSPVTSHPLPFAPLADVAKGGDGAKSTFAAIQVSTNRNCRSEIAGK